MHVNHYQIPWVEFVRYTYIHTAGYSWETMQIYTYTTSCTERRRLNHMDCLLALHLRAESAVPQAEPVYTRHVLMGGAAGRKKKHLWSTPSGLQKNGHLEILR